MYGHRLRRERLIILAPLSLLLLFAVACGSASTGSSTTTGSAAATPTCPPSRFQQETRATTSALKEGISVSVAAAQGGSFYTATRVMLLGNRGTGQGAFGGRGTGTGASGGNGQARNPACFRRGLGANAAGAGSTGTSNITGTACSGPDV